MAKVKGITGNKFPKTGETNIYEVIREDNTLPEDYENVSWQLYLKDETGNWIKHPKSAERKQKGAKQSYAFGELFTNQELLLTAFNEKAVFSEPPALKITPIAGDPKITKFFFTDLTGKTLEEIFYNQRMMLQIHTVGMLGKKVNYSIYYDANGTKTEVRKGQSKEIIKPNGVVNPEESFMIDMPIRTGQSTSADEHHFKIKIWETGNEANFLEQDLKIKNQTVNQMSDPETQVPITTGTSEPVKKKEEEKNKKCFCDRDLELDELKLIVKQLRLSEGKTSTSLFSDENCPLSSSDKTYDRLLEELNKTFNKHHINTCIRKIHFLAQSYHETSRLGTTLEYASGKGYDPGQHTESAKHDHTVTGDGPRYKGRGAMQLTWRDTQKEYFEYILKKNPSLLGNKKIEDLFNRRKQYQEKYIYFRDKLDKNGKPIFNSKGKKEREKVIDLIDVDSAGLLANNLFFAIDSAGWFWDVYKTIEYGSKTNREKYQEILHKNLNEVSDYGDKYLSIISKFVNGGGNGMPERQVYYNELKNNVFKFNTKCVNRNKIKK